MALGSGLQFAVVVDILARIDGGDCVFFFGPGTQVDLLAALRAKKDESGFFRPTRLCSRR